MNRSQVLFITLLTAAMPVIGQAASLPDTGQTLCDDGSNVLVACSNANSGDAATMPGQDGRYGRDPANIAGLDNKVGAGDAGFDYTKIANNGSTLEAGIALGNNAADWACTQDNITGLMWEVKVDSIVHLRNKGSMYSWYSDATRGDGTSNELNGGDAGSVNNGRCLNQYDETTNPGGNYCDTAGYVAAINATNLCGYDDWRVPSRRELNTIIHMGNLSPSIDTTYFPNTETAIRNYWSASTSIFADVAWEINFSNGLSGMAFKYSYSYLRLVRGSRFQILGKKS